MEFDWLDTPFEFKFLKPKEIEESFEDPFSLRLIPDLPDNDDAARYISLGRTISNQGVFSVFWTDGKIHRVILARPMTPDEEQFYDRKNAEAAN